MGLRWPGRGADKSDMDQRCDLTELMVSDCAHCRHKDDPAWPAKYEGHCALCTAPIEIGQSIRWSQDGGEVEHGYHSRSLTPS